MGTDFYIKRVKPRGMHDEYHIAERGGPARTPFRAYTPDGAGDDRPAVHSVDDIECLLSSGEYALAGERGEEWEPGEDSVRAFREELLGWDGGTRLGYREDCGGGCADSRGFRFVGGDFR